MNIPMPAIVQPKDNADKNKLLYGLLIGVLLLLLTTLASLMIGAKSLSLTSIFNIFFHHQKNSIDYVIIYDNRMVRTLLAILCGMAFGVAGALMQAITRNPLADPGILGVNTGASFAVVLAIGFFGLNSIQAHLWFAFFGAIIVTIAVYLLGTMGRNSSNSVRLLLAGVAISAMLTGIGTGISLLNPQNFASTRIWSVGSLTGRDMDVILAVLPFILIGLCLALFSSRSLNIVALGDELARSLGAHIGKLRLIAIIAITLLAGGATAAVGPIGFIGLMVPHIVRWFTGPDQRWIIVLTMIYGAILLLLADIIGRLVLFPAEIAAGIVTAFIGAALLIVLVRVKKVSGL